MVADPFRQFKDGPIEEGDLVMAYMVYIYRAYHISLIATVKRLNRTLDSGERQNPQ